MDFGSINYYNISDWWLDVFSDNEREKITSIHKDFIEGEISSMSASATQYLSNAATWFKSEEDRNIAYKLLEKAEELSATAAVLDRHFLYQIKKDIYYRFRNIDDFALTKAIEACEQQIAMSNEAAAAFKKIFNNDTLPAHVGYLDLAIIREKQGRLEDAIRLCKEALVQKWSGDWEKRIKRYKSKLESLNPSK